jgi:hypothetical protein
MGSMMKFNSSCLILTVDFQRLVDMAIIVENKLKEMERNVKQKNAISRAILGRQHKASLTSDWPLLQSTIDDSPTDAGSASSVSDAATQSPDAVIEFLDATLSAASTSA